MEPPLPDGDGLAAALQGPREASPGSSRGPLDEGQRGAVRAAELRHWAGEEHCFGAAAGP